MAVGKKQEPQGWLTKMNNIILPGRSIYQWNGLQVLTHSQILVSCFRTLPLPRRRKKARLCLPDPFIVEVDYLETKRNTKATKVQANKTLAKQKATKKANKTKNKATKKAQAKRRASKKAKTRKVRKVQPKKHKQNKEVPEVFALRRAFWRTFWKGPLGPLVALCFAIVPFCLHFCFFCV